MKFNKHSTLLFLFLIFFASYSFSQAKESTDKYSSKKKRFQLDPERMVLGGGFGAQFGSVTAVEISPTFGYLLTENLLAGVGARYMYFEEKILTYTFSTNIYGGSVFTQYFFLEDYLAHVEYEVLNLEDFSEPESRININSFFIGGGYRSMLGESSFATILLLYNLNDDINSPYTNPIIRIGLGFGL